MSWWIDVHSVVTCVLTFNLMASCLSRDRNYVILSFAIFCVEVFAFACVVVTRALEIFCSFQGPVIKTVTSVLDAPLGALDA